MMRFSLLLYGFYMLLRFTSWMDVLFRDRLKERDFVMTIKTSDGTRARSFTSRDGALSTRRGVPPESDFSLVWKDARSGFNYMIAMKLGALMKAVTKGSLKLEGDAAAVSWFLETFKFMMKYYGKAAG
jgi:hypothetical protein